MLSKNFIAKSHHYFSQAEVKSYIDYADKKYPDKIIEELEIIPDGNDHVILKYTFKNVPFERIRRITGYLVGTIDRFNNAKRAEVSERSKHYV